MASGLSSTKIGEVIEANTVEFRAQSYELHDSPPFGSFVRAGDGDEIYGVTYQAETTSIKPARRPIARGRDEETEEDVFRNNPQLPRLLRTDFQVLTIAHRSDGQLRHYLPPRPPHVHGFVYRCRPEDVIELTNNLDFLQVILTARATLPVDELLAATIRSAADVREDRRAFLVAARRQLALLLGGEFQRLNGILRRIRPEDRPLEPAS